MVVLRRHSRTVSFRLTEDEYEQLQRRSVTCGMHSVSDFAREATRQSLIGDPPQWPEVLRRKMTELDDEVKRLARLLEGTKE